SDSVLAITPADSLFATGCRRRRLDSPGSDHERVIIASDVLEKDVDIGEKVLFIDDHHHQEGLSIAEYIAVEGREVTVISREWIVGTEIDTTLRPDLYARLDQLGVTLKPITNAKAINADGTVVVENYYSHIER